MEVFNPRTFFTIVRLSSAVNMSMLSDNYLTAVRTYGTRTLSKIRSIRKVFEGGRDGAPMAGFPKRRSTSDLNLIKLRT